MSKSVARSESLQPDLWIMNHLQMRSIQKKVETFSGLSGGNDRDDLLRRRIVMHINQTKTFGFNQYMTLLDTDPEALLKLVNEITINETFLFRDIVQLQIWFEKLVKPHLQQGHEIDIWSAACSTGEEPTTLALMLSEACKNAQARFHIFASDINKDVLQKAREGIFIDRSISHAPKKIVDEYFTKTTEGFRVSDAITSHITYFQHNLLDSPPLYKEQYDFVFLRNVLIYFSDENRRSILQKIANVLKPNGILVMGACESPLTYSDQFVRVNDVDALLFRKI